MEFFLMACPLSMLENIYMANIGRYLENYIKTDWVIGCARHAQTCVLFYT